MEIPITELTRVILRSLSFDSVWFCRFNVVSLSPYSDFYVEILDSGVSAADVTVLNADPTRTGLAELPRSDEIARSRRVSSCYWWNQCPRNRARPTRLSRPSLTAATSYRVSTMA